MIIQNLMQNYNRYLVSLVSISLISLSMNILMFSESPLAQIFFIVTYDVLLGINFYLHMMCCSSIIVINDLKLFLNYCL